MSIAALILVMTVLSDIARVTEYGLSLTEWAFVTGFLPPHGQAGWMATFERYRHILHYRNLDQGVTLASFKTLFYWEYAHHVLARLTALAAIIPPIVFLYQGRIPGWRALRCFAVPVLVLAQDFCGYLMTWDAAFLQGDASRYRVAAHLTLAVLTYGYVVWCAADILRREPLWLANHAKPWFRLAARVILALVIVAIVCGGLRTGLASHTLGNLPPAVLPNAAHPDNPLLSPNAAQWYHRILGLLTLAAVGAFWLGGCERRMCKAVKMPLHGMMASVVLLSLLGMASSFVALPFVIVAHQATAFMLYSFALLTLHGLKDIKRPVPVCAKKA
ncbi:MAG TPA: COX15/CtaA family protein [Stellaceae bacterium]|nr:COX15/CtaA family protein [Stellaceae bacterium]